jgi:tripartite-type tricarboxylate transporter receptor subunit TctC
MIREGTTRRRMIVGLASALCAYAGGGMAQEARTGGRQLRLVVPFPPGGSTDALARIVAPRLAERIGETVIVDNKPGAGGNIGAASVAREPADANVVMFAATSVVINPTIHAANSPFRLFEDLVPVTKLVDIPCAVLVGPSLQVKNLSELVALAKSRPGGLTMASAGFGTVPHVGGEFFKAITGTDMTHVPHKGQSEMLRELIAGRVDVVIDLLAGSLPHIQSGRLRALAVTSSVRQDALPEVPTAEEAGVKGYVVSAHQSMWAPASTPPARIQQLNQVVGSVLREPEVEAAMKRMLMTAAPTSVADAERYLRAEVAKWANYAKAGDATRN